MAACGQRFRLDVTVVTGTAPPAIDVADRDALYDLLERGRSPIDTNILIYAHRAETPAHTSALGRIRELAEGRAPWGIPVFCLAKLPLEHGIDTILTADRDFARFPWLRPIGL